MKKIVKLSMVVVSAVILLAVATRYADSQTKGGPSTKTNGSVGYTSILNNFTVDNTALVLVDHQVGTIDWAGEINTEQRSQLKAFAKLIAKFAKGAGMPIVLTSSLENEAQGPLLPEFKTIMPEEYAARIKRTGVINAWDDPAFADAVRKTGRKNILIAGLTTDVCLVPPELSARLKASML
ncbi:MAG: isochorismatase family protein [Nitrospirae bacterium]|nr:isochorismatase family protein [Nitrospirota bacterium]